MVTLSLSFFGDQQVSRTLDRWAGRVGDLSPAFRTIRERFLTVEQRQFASEGKTGSGGWAPLSPPYASWKAGVRPGAPILVFDGHLKRALTSAPDVDVIEAHTMAVGTAIEYGAYHQHGTDRMPARPPVDLTDNFRRQAMKILQAFVVSGSTYRGV